MMYTDNTDVGLHIGLSDRVAEAKLKEYKFWLVDNNIKYSYVYSPQWSNFPAAINMRNEDAIMFKLRFGL
jgi:hypothetical protein